MLILRHNFMGYYINSFMYLPKRQLFHLEKFIHHVSIFPQWINNTPLSKDQFIFSSNVVKALQVIYGSWFNTIISDICMISIDTVKRGKSGQILRFLFSAVLLKRPIELFHAYYNVPTQYLSLECKSRFKQYFT